MKIYFYFSVHESLFHRVAVRLVESHGVTAAGGFVYGKDQEDRLRATDFDWYRLDVLSTWLGQSKGTKPDEAYLRQAERLYGRPTFSRMVFADRHFLDLPHDELIKVIDVVIRRAEELFSTDAPDAFVLESVGDLVSFLLWSVATCLGIRCLLVDSSHIPGRAVVYHNQYSRWERVEDAFDRLAQRDLTDLERRDASRFVADFRERRPRFYRPGRAFIPSINQRDLTLLLQWMMRRRRDPANRTLRTGRQMVRQRLDRLGRHLVASRLRYFEQPVGGERYFVFPLQFYPESSMSVWATFYLNQVALVEDVAKSLPVTHRLYVKEHFASIGRTPLGHYRRIRELWNTRLIDPNVDSFDLVAHSSGVITATNTMGWEALLAGKPVVTFGEVFYNAYPQVIRAGRYPKEEWPELIRSLVDGFQLDEEMLLKFIAAILAETVATEVNWDNPMTAMRTGVLDDDNIDNTARLLAAHLPRPSRTSGS